MKQIDQTTLSLFEWLAEHDISLEKLSKTNARLYTLIDEYIHLMEAVGYWADKSKGSDKVFSRLLKDKEQEIIKIFSRQNERGQA